MQTPEGLKPVLAQIHHPNDLGMSTWYEVVYFDDDAGHWRCFVGSDIFSDGHQVLKWKYAEECF
jgi:hypothetical protein